MALVEFTISGVAKTGIRIGSLNIDRVLSQRDRCTLQIDDDAGSYSPDAGLDLGVFIEGTRVFGGIIASVERVRTPGHGRRENRVECVGYEAICDRRTVGDASTPTVVYTNAYANDIVRDLISTWCAADGIDISAVTAGAGPIIDSIEFTLTSVSDALNQVCAIAERKWLIDVDKKIRFLDPTTGSALHTITTSSGNALEGSVQVKEDLSQYANRVIVELPNAKIETSDSFDGSHPTQPTDGARKDWELTYPVVDVIPVVEVDAVAKTVGIRGVDTGKDWYYVDGSATLSQDTGATALPNTSTLVVTYTGRRTVFVQADNASQQTTRAAAELNSGIYTRLIKSDQAVAVADAQQLADAILDQVDEPSFVLTLTSLDFDDVTPGSRVTFNAIGVNKTFTVRSLNISTVGNEVYYRLEAAAGPIMLDGFETFATLSGGGGSMSVQSSVNIGAPYGDWYLVGPNGVNTVTLNFANGNAQRVDLVLATGPFTMANPSNASTSGLEVIVMLIPRGLAVTFGANWKLPDWAVVDPTTATYTIAAWKVDATGMRLTKWLTGIPL